MSAEELEAEVDILLEKKEYEAAVKLLGHHRAPQDYMVSQMRAQKQFALSKSKIQELPHLEVKNPKYATASPMKLYFIHQLIELSQKTFVCRNADNLVNYDENGEFGELQKGIGDYTEYRNVR